LLELFPMQRPYKVGAASADVRVGNWLIYEDGRKLSMSLFSESDPFVLLPGSRVLVDMLEETTLPLDLAAMFTLKSTRAREGYQHAVAGWVDPGWKGVLTMEITNTNQTKSLPLYAGLPMGQLIFMQVIDGGQYEGRYQGSTEVSAAREEV